ncbi:MAG: hypothetical protein ACXVEF_36345 [Polyangiales bacterium]
MDIDLHPYDGQERRFRHDDESDKEVAIAVVERVLRLQLPRPVPSLQYDLSFFSGGIGIIDHLAISLRADAAAVARALGFEAAASASSDDIEWLADGDMLAFIAEHKAPFQPSPASLDGAFVDPESGPNSWQLLYARDGLLHYLAFDQG